MFQKISYILLLTFLALSCTDIVKEADHTNTIDFQTAASTDSWVETKSAPVTELTEPFGIFAYCYKGDWSETNTANFMNNLPVSKNGSYWQTAINYYWPGSSYNMKFFAYYPYAQSQLGISSTTGTLQLSYTVPADVADQADVMTASVAYPGDHYDPVDLHFQHVLTAIRFAVGDDMIGCTISKITIKGVYGYGLYKVGDASWTGQGNVRNYEQTLDVTVDGTPGADITTAIQTFMMIPQTIPSGATIEVNLVDAYTSTSRTISGSIAGGVWPLGTPITYRISSTGISVVPTLIVSRPDDFNYQGGTHTYSVTSYRTISQTGYTTVNQPVPWTAEYSTDGGVTWTSSKPSWLTDFTESGDGSVSATSFNATVTAQTGKTHNQALQDATPLSNYDLSTKGGTTAMNTANCYIINAPGTYTFPLVYGNAIKNGATNTSSYISSASGTGVLTHFVNHLGNEITDPYIYNNTGCVPANACIAWQDANNLLSDIALSADGHYVTFTVSASSIVQGNTLIVVRDASNIVLWSWHIWVTDYVPELPANNSDDAPLSDKNILSYNGNTYVLMPINLGWRDENLNNYYPSRSVKVKISQIGTNAVPVEFNIHQTAYPMSKKGYNTFYQWGRKDPTKTSNGNLYNQNLDFDYIKGPISLAEGIKNPNIFYMITSETDWCSSHYLNLWNANDVTMSNNVSTVVKTIYDPCPVGYEVAAPDCFSGFTVNGQDKNGTSNYKGHVNSASFNSPYMSGAEVTNNYGWFFYCNKMSGINSYDTSGGTIFFPNSGFKERGNKSYSTNRVVCLTATPYDSSNEACRFFASNIDVNPESHKSRAYGFPVRGMREQ